MAQHNTEERKETFLKALEKSLGVITEACRKSEIPRRTVYDWIGQDKEFAASVRETEDIALDFAESQLFEQIRDKNTAATIFYLKTRGKKRGYIERSEFTVDVNKMSDQQVDQLLNQVMSRLENDG